MRGWEQLPFPEQTNKQPKYAKFCAFVCGDEGDHIGNRISIFYVLWCFPKKGVNHFLYSSYFNWSRTTVNFLFKFSNLLKSGIYNWPSPLTNSSTDKSYDIRTRFREHYLMSDHYQPPKIDLNGDLGWNSAAFLIGVLGA